MADELPIRLISQAHLDFHNYMRQQYHRLPPVQEFVMHPAIPGTATLGPPVLCRVDPSIQEDAFGNPLPAA